MRHSVELVLATVFDVTIAKRSQFLYTIYGILENQATLYVGQTRAKAGPLSRLAQHLSDADNNTYLQCLARTYRCEQVPLEKVNFVAIRFVPRKMFQIDSPVYREAVEDLVQRGLINWVLEHDLGICVVSRTDPNSYNRLPEIQEEADRISSDLKSWILEFHL